MTLRSPPGDEVMEGALKRVILTGVLGQVGSELLRSLRHRYGHDSVIATDIRNPPDCELIASGPFFLCDCRDRRSLTEIVREHRVDTIFHMAAILSATAEKIPQKAWDVNITGLTSVLEVAREESCSLFVPSSIAAFGSQTPRKRTPQDTIQRPSSLYGVSKVTGELLCDYYFHRFGVDTRGVRYPGIISHLAPPGGGTTDYAVAIYHDAVESGAYRCPLDEETTMAMIYMPDAVRAALELMEAPSDRLRHRNAFNLAAMSFSPKEQARSIQRYLPSFTITYEKDPLLQGIADSWPESLDDSAAQEEWGWAPSYDLDRMSYEMLAALSQGEIHAV